MYKIFKILLISGSLFSLSAATAIVRPDANIREEPSKDSKIDKGWVEGSWIKGDYTQKQQDNIAMVSNVKESSSNTQDNMLQIKQQKVQQVIDDKKKPNKVIAQKPKKEIFTKYFIGISSHYNTLSISKKDIVGSIILNENLDDKASSIGLHAGTKINNYIVSANYEVLNLDNIKVQSTYLALDYRFETILNPYIGISLGVSNLEWQIDPLVNSKIKDKKLSSLIYGLQAGIEFNIINHWNIYSDIMYQKFNFTTDLISRPAVTEIKYEDKKSIGLGIRYWF